MDVLGSLYTLELINLCIKVWKLFFLKHSSEAYGVQLCFPVQLCSSAETNAIEISVAF